MKLTLSILTAVVLLLAGCIQPVVTPPAEAPTQSAPVVKQTIQPAAIPTETLIQVPTETVVLPPPALPVCSPEASVTGCEIPTALELDRFCSDKVPYTLFAVSPGTTMEAVTPNFTCKDEGLRSGKQQYSCTGTPEYTFKARVCNTACVAPVLQTSEQCPQGYGINTAQNCCVPVETGNGCTILALQIGQCNQ